MNRKEFGFALLDSAVALLIVSLAAVLVVQTGGANAVARTQALARGSAARLAAELSEWMQRHGDASLAEPVAQLIARPENPAMPCHEGECDAAQGARHFLYAWRMRLQRTIPGVRAEVCNDHPPVDDPPGWACDPDGSASVLKLGWPAASGATGFSPALAIELGPAA